MFTTSLITWYYLFLSATWIGAAFKLSIKFTSIPCLMHSRRIESAVSGSLSYFTKSKWIMLAPIDVFTFMSNPIPLILRSLKQMSNLWLNIVAWRRYPCFLFYLLKSMFLLFTLRSTASRKMEQYSLVCYLKAHKKGDWPVLSSMSMSMIWLIAWQIGCRDSDISSSFKMCKCLFEMAVWTIHLCLRPYFKFWLSIYAIAS